MTQDLRARRRQATEQELHDTALGLIERQGYAATTVDEIASAAGVSQRTFFRYFATKEDAVLLGYRALDEAIDTLDLPEEPRAALECLLDFHQSQIDQLGADEAERYVTLQRVINAEPALRDAVAARELATMERLRIRLSTSVSDDEPLTSRLIAEMATALLRVTFDHWRSSDHCAVSELPGLYRRVRSAARDLVQT